MPSELRVDKVSSTTSPYDPVFSTTGGALSHRNMIINGAMQVAQRGTSATVDGYGTVDRFRANLGGNDENATQAQHALTSSDTGPYEEGFRYSLQITNGNQTSGAGTGDRVGILYRMEAQDIANSGWNYTSSSSYITLSFWCKSSVSQNFYVRVTSDDGTAQNYVFETGSLTANTWTKITKTIPGNSNLQFDNDTGIGLDIEVMMFRGTDTTGSVTLNAWGAYNSSVRIPDMTSTWYTTNDATWELTGVQLERGSVATPFEHRSYADELRRCQRYFQKFYGSTNYWGSGAWYSTTQANIVLDTFGPMRADPIGSSSSVSDFRIGNSNMSGVPTVTSMTITTSGTAVSGKFRLYVTTGSGGSAGNATVFLAYNGSTEGIINLDAEL